MYRRKNVVKIISIFLIVLGITILLIIASYDRNKEKEETYQWTQLGIEKTITFFAKGDKVMKVIAVKRIPYTSLEVTTKDDAKKVLEAETQKVKTLEGVEVDIIYKNDVAIETISVNYEKMERRKIGEAIEGVMVFGDEENGVSLKKSIRLLEVVGYKKVK